MSQAYVGSAGGGGGGSGTVTSFSFTDANGFTGTVTNPTTTPDLTLETSVGDFEVIYADGGALTGTGVGTAGQILTSNGAGNAPTWQNNSSLSGFIKIKTLTASNSASLAFTSTDITSSYTAYMIIFNNILSVNAGTFFMDWSQDNGSTYLNSNYQSGTNTQPWNTGAIANLSSTTTNPITGSGTQSQTYPTSGQLYLYAVGTLQKTNFVGQIFQSGNITSAIYGNQIVDVSINNIKFIVNSGNIASGTITLYGMLQ